MRVKISKVLADRYASWYISTAQQTDNWSHDWFNILSGLGMLMYNYQLAWLAKMVAVILMLVSIGTGGWLLWQMRKLKKSCLVKSKNMKFVSNRIIKTLQIIILWYKIQILCGSGLQAK